MISERNKYLTEAMGECWHDMANTSARYILRCTKCGLENDHPNVNPDFSIWSGFGKFWEWAQKQKWWESFCGKKLLPGKSGRLADLYLNIHPDRFADAVYEFLKEQENE